MDSVAKTFKLSNSWYDEDGKIFKKTKVVFKPGLTVLVGCNGSGKTTMLNQIKEQLDRSGTPVLYHSNLLSGARDRRSKALSNGDYRFVALTMGSSEGENIVNVMGMVAKEMGAFANDNADTNELWFLFDAIDSGLSVDNIVELKEYLIDFVIKKESGRDVYFVVSANEYEFARCENCLDVANVEYMRFDNYEEYRNFIIDSRKQKDALWAELASTKGRRGYGKKTVYF